MKRFFGKGFFVFFLSLAHAACALQAAAAPADDFDEVAEFDAFYLNANGGVLLPGNGTSLKRAGFVSARAGWYVREDFAWELGVLSAPNVVSKHGGNEALTGVSAGALYHLLGYERFDPFATFGAATLFGARHVFGDDSHRTATGPVGGVGAFWHFTERLSARCDARALLAVDSPCGMVYAVSAGLSWGF